MSKRYTFCTRYALALFAALFFSCAALPPSRDASSGAFPPKTPPAGIPAEIPRPPALILGQGLVSPDRLALFLENNNPLAGGDFTRSLASCYVEEAAAEGVNHDAAFAQMCLETGFLRYGGLVTADMNNFCGLGAIGENQRGERFPDVRTGVRAHIQHLKAYASQAPLKGELVDPRYRWVRAGSAPAIADLAGKWAADRDYGGKIDAILERMYDAAFNSGGKGL
ncbi:MAG: glucosaminidase domain-containing protein [Treponema sp.]|jgi:hypothetical protein|nr:glucosaminidase domain-containing protein [Treponema sp.]